MPGDKLGATIAYDVIDELDEASKKWKNNDNTKVTFFAGRDKPLKILADTKQERQLLNYKRYLNYWDKHEARVHQHFLERSLTTTKSAS